MDSRDQTELSVSEQRLVRRVAEALAEYQLREPEERDRALAVRLLSRRGGPLSQRHDEPEFDAEALIA